MSGPADIDKLWNAIGGKDKDYAINLIEIASKKEVGKEICENAVNIIVFGKNLRDSISCLHLVCKRGYVKILEEMFKNVKDLNENLRTSILGWSPLHYASFGGHARAARLLFEHGAEANKSSVDGKTPLHLALERGFKKIVVLLIQHNADLTVKDRDKNTVLHYCVKSETGKDTKWTPEDKSDMAEFLMMRGASCSEQNVFGDTPLHMAATGSDSDLVLRLLSADEGTNATRGRNVKGETPILMANDKNVIEVLLDHGSRVNDQNNEGSSLLHLHTGDLDIVKMLIDHGADPALLDVAGRSPLHLAVQKRNPSKDVIQLLLPTVDLNYQDSNGDTVLHAYCQNTSSSLQCYVSADNRVKMQPIIQNDQDVILDLLLSDLIDTNTRNNDGQTPIFLAMRIKQYVKVRMLFHFGANPNIRDKKGSSARQVDPKWFKRNFGKYMRPKGMGSRVIQERYPSDMSQEDSHLPNISKRFYGDKENETRPSTFPPTKQLKLPEMRVKSSAFQPHCQSYTAQIMKNSLSPLTSQRPLVVHSRESTLHLLPNWLGKDKASGKLFPEISTRHNEKMNGYVYSKNILQKEKQRRERTKEFTTFKYNDKSEPRLVTVPQRNLHASGRLREKSFVKSHLLVKRETTKLSSIDEDNADNNRGNDPLYRYVRNHFLEKFMKHEA